MQRTPTAKVFGILNLAFAVMGIFGVLATFLLPYLPGQANNPVLEIMKENAIYHTWMLMATGLGLISVVLLTVGGIGLLQYKPWGRTASIIYAIFGILVAIATSVVNGVVLMPIMMEKAKDAQGPEAAGAIGGAIGGVVGGCFGLIYPIVLLVFMLRRSFVDSYRPPMAPPPVPMGH
jgi:hypothetical protein